MFDFGCHRIEVLLDIFGPISDISAMLKTVALDRQVEDTAVAIFQFEKGPCGTLSIAHAAREAQDTLDIFGSEGSIHVASLNEGIWRVSNSDGERVEATPPHTNFHLPLIDDFTKSVLGQFEPAVTGEIGREVARIVAAIYAKPD